MRISITFFLRKKKRTEVKMRGLINAEKLSMRRSLRVCSFTEPKDVRLTFFSRRRSLNSFVFGSPGRAHYTRTLSPTCLLLPPADLKVRGDSPPVPSWEGDTWEAERCYIPSTKSLYLSLSFSIFPLHAFLLYSLPCFSIARRWRIRICVSRFI